MDLIQILALALLQGLTEFLPISSSAHLILFPKLVGWEDQGLAFDVAVHLGTLCAVIYYLRKEIAVTAIDGIHSIIERRPVGDSRLAWGVVVGTLPAGLAGLLLNNFVETTLRSPLVIAVTTILFGLALWWADASGKRNVEEQKFSWLGFIVVGCAQALAIVPGTSRSGITITAGLMMGLTRPAAARLSFLLSIPIIIAAAGLKLFELVDQTSPVDWRAVVLGAVISGLSAYLCIHVFLKMLDRISLFTFVVYRLLLGAVLLYLFL